MIESAGPIEDSLVSTIIPVHDRPALLQEAVDSVLAQSYRPLEVVIIDDGSTDDTARVADRLAAEHLRKVRALHVPNGGPGLAREAGRSVARGEFIQYLDSDDILLPGKFERQVDALRAEPESGVCYGMTRYIDKSGHGGDRPWRRTGERVERMFPSFLVDRWWGTSTPLYRRSVIDAVGPWTGLWNEEDWEYDCRVAALGLRLAYVPHFVSEQRGHAGGRLSRDGSRDPAKLRDRAAAHALILGHARRAGIGPRQEEMRHFAREVFLLCRQCGAVGLVAEARRLHELAVRASDGDQDKHLDLRVYGAVARVIGWSRMGSLACALDRRRGRWQGR
ncbi:MAG TPA: glycosyltransferase family A protein [Gemmatimonadota bacterium]|nr:glycosyltransferase family A protein [Gemmatimonadota bacterium]